MPTLRHLRMLAPALAAAAMLAFQPALAEKPSWAGGGKPDRSDDDKARGKSKKHKKAKKASPDTVRFDDRQRHAARDYYGERVRSGRCPPGLAKKNNGCMPPGQAKKWRVGQPLPRDVRYYTPPHEIVVRIGLPPPGYKLVRIANDILMIDAGTRMVVDAIEDLGRL